SSEKILKIISDKPEISAKDIAVIIGISSRAIEKQIDKLKKQGNLKRIGPDKGGYWKVIDVDK
ncbi:MAG: transcriptional regulator, partial [Bacteroidetes bacterium]